MAMLLRRHRKARAAGVTTSANVAPTTAPEADEVKPYAEWRKADLQAEVDKRNEAIENDADKIKRSGKVAELAARLDAHDAALAAAADESGESEPQGDGDADESGENPDETGESGDDSAEQGDGGENPEGDADDAAGGDESDDTEGNA